MQTYPFDIQHSKFFPKFDHLLYPQVGSSSGLQKVSRAEDRAETLIKGSLEVRPPNYTVNDYRVGEANTIHATMVYEFLRLFCREEPSPHAADAVLIVDIQGCIHGYGYRHDSSFGDLVARWNGCLITEMLSERMKRQWLNQNIDSLALQRRHWRLFRLYESGTSQIVLMEFHPVEMQSTALVLWSLET